MSTELIVAPSASLPNTIEELSQFILFGREKLTAVRAEIRAIDKLKLAEEVHQQKQEEATMLAEALLDAEVRIGELFKKIPKKQGKRTDLKLPRSGAEKLETKSEIVEAIGFSEDQVQRLEALADNPDAVEFVKAEARENAEIPTRKRVLEVVSRKKNGGIDGYDNYFKFHMKVCNEFEKIVSAISKFQITDHRIDALLENFGGVTSVSDTIKYIEAAQEKLLAIITELRKAAKRKKSA